MTKIDHFADAVAMEAVDVVLMDPHFFGGIRASVTAAAICGAFGLGVGMHSSGECGVSLAAMLHAAAAMPQLAHSADAHYHHMTDDVIIGGKLEYRDGAIAVPSGPGLGVELDPDRVARYHELYRKLGPYAVHRRRAPSRLGTDDPGIGLARRVIASRSVSEPRAPVSQSKKCRPRGFEAQSHALAPCGLGSRIDDRPQEATTSDGIGRRRGGLAAGR